MTWMSLCPPPFRFLRWFARRPSDSMVYGGHVERQSGLDRIIANLGPRGFNVYIGLNFTDRWEGIRIKSADITTAGAIVLDLDPVPGAVERDGIAGAFEAGRKGVEIAGTLIGQTLSACYIDSGRGVQAWILIEPKALRLPEERQQFRDGTGALLRGVSGLLGEWGGTRLDTSCSDLARVVRAPGSPNQKTGRIAKVLEWGERNDISGAILALGRQHAPTPRARLNATDSLTLDKVWSQLTVTARRFIRDGVQEPGRHAGAFATAAALREAGIPEPRALQILHAAARNCVPQLPAPDTERCVRNAYHR